MRSLRVQISGLERFAPIDLFREVGFMRQFSRRVRVAAMGGRGLQVKFEAVMGLPVVSGISVKRIS